MRILMLNGSPRPNGNTFLALSEIGKQLKEEGIDYEIFQIGGAPIRDCLGCGKCTENGCVFTDESMSSLRKQKTRTALFSARPFIMRIRADVYFRSLTERFTAAAERSDSSPEPPLRLPDEEERPPRSTV